MRLFLAMLMFGSFTVLMGQDEETEIRKQIEKFSTHFMAGERSEMVKMYTIDAKIMPNNTDILGGKELGEYWNPQEVGEWKTTYHKVTPEEIKVWGDEAYDYGYYEGTSSKGEDSSNWKGKYVIIWRKEKGTWKIYLDIWNSIKL